jgi:hypothetical protein
VNARAVNTAGGGGEIQVIANPPALRLRGSAAPVDAARPRYDALVTLRPLGTAPLQLLQLLASLPRSVVYSSPVTARSCGVV